MVKEYLLVQIPFDEEVHFLSSPFCNELAHRINLIGTRTQWEHFPWITRTLIVTLQQLSQLQFLQLWVILCLWSRNKIRRPIHESQLRRHSGIPYSLHFAYFKSRKTFRKAYILVVWGVHHPNDHIICTSSANSFYPELYLSAAQKENIPPDKNGECLFCVLILG